MDCKAFYIFTVFMYNLLAVLVTFMLSSVWHAILDNFRPITVWATDLVIFYCINPFFGETWTPYSYLQVVGMVVLLYGTAIYNAPNDGSLLLEGQWWAMGIDCSDDYAAIRRQQEEEELDAKLEVKRREFEVRNLVYHGAYRLLHITFPLQPMYINSPCNLAHPAPRILCGT